MARFARTPAADATRRPEVYFICGAGLGSSLACQMEAEEVLREAGLVASLHHDGISGLPGLQADVIVSAQNFRPTIEKYGLDPSITLVFLHNIVDRDEIRDQLVPAVRGLQEDQPHLGNHPGPGSQEPRPDQADATGKAQP